MKKKLLALALALCLAFAMAAMLLVHPTKNIIFMRKTDEDVTGVYILSGGVVEFRKIRIRVRRDGYVIAETYEEVKALLDTYTDEQYKAATADGWGYLRLNDNIITSGNELYEGKMIS